MSVLLVRFVVVVAVSAPAGGLCVVVTIFFIIFLVATIAACDGGIFKLVVLDDTITNPWILSYEYI